MKKILKTIFIMLGIIFIILVVAAVLFIIFDPFNLKSLLPNLLINPKLNVPTSTEGSDKHPLLNEEQEKLLETIGIDVGSLPTEVTPEMEKCFIETLGAERVKEIMEGASPGPMDLFKAKGCL